MGIDIARTTASVQGFGNVAQYAVRLYHQLGGKVVCVACWDQARPDLLLLPQEGGRRPRTSWSAITDRFGGIDKAKAKDLGYEVLPGDAWIEQDVDILIPAALENQISGENAPHQGDGQDHRRRRQRPDDARGRRDPPGQGIFLIPDFLANAGGVTCSYFEQVQCNMNYFWEKDEVLAKLDTKMTSAFHAVHDLARSASSTCATPPT